MLPKLLLVWLLIATSAIHALGQSAPYCWIWETGSFSPSYMFLHEQSIYGGGLTYVRKYDSRNNLVWSRALSHLVLGMSADTAGGFYAAGTYSGNLFLDTAVIMTSKDPGLYVIRFTTEGEPDWVKSITATGDLQLTSITTDKVNRIVHLAGKFSGMLTIGSYTLTDASGGSFTAAFSGMDGHVLSAYNYQPPDPAYLTYPAYTKMDGRGNIYYANYSYDTVRIGTYTIARTCHEVQFFWCAKFDSTGTLLWVKDLVPCVQKEGLQYYREYHDFYVDDLGYLYVSHIDGHWPAQGDPASGIYYANTFMLTPDGMLSLPNTKITNSYPGTHPRRLIVYARNRRALVRKIPSDVLEYVGDVPDRYKSSDYLVYGSAKGSLAGVDDTVKQVFYFSGSNGLAKLVDGFEIDAGKDVVICKSDTGHVTLGGALPAGCAYQPFSIRWSPSTGLSSDTVNNPILYPYQMGDRQTYVLSVTDGPYTKTDTVQVTKLAGPARPVIAANNNVLYVASTPGLHYQWFLNGQAIEQATGASLTITQAGTYTVQVTDALGCSAMSLPYYAKLTALRIAVYPSLVVHDMQIRYTLPAADYMTIDVFNIFTGYRNVLVNRQWQVEGRHTLYLKHVRFPRGLYVIRIRTSNNQAIDKFIVL